MKTALQFWGKARSHFETGPRWHPLAWHSLDVAAVLERLLACAFAEAAPAAMHRPLVVLAALHDVGKFTRPFQALAPEHWPAALGLATGRVSSARHDTLGWRILIDGRLEADLATLLPDWETPALLPLLRAVTGHHGRPPMEDGDSSRPLPREIFCPVCQQAVREWIQIVAQLLGPVTDPPPPEMEAARISWRAAGLVNLADWIGSATPPFDYAEPDDDIAGYWTVARERARRAVAASGLESAAISPFAGFATVFPNIRPPSPMQEWAAGVELPRGPTLALIEDATGSGKTEAALTLSHRIMADGRAGGLFFALPTMATADAMFARLGNSYRRMFAVGAEPSLVLAHGHAALHAGFKDSILRDSGDSGQVEEDDDAHEGRDAAGPACAAWIADDRRKAFLAQIGVGTIDQALLGVLPSRYAALRLLGLSRRVLIVDEAHAYDPYMRAELHTLLRFQAILGGSAVVLSATLPQAMRRELADAFRDGAGSVLVSQAYPLATIIGTDGASEHPICARRETKRRVPVRRLADAAQAIGEIKRAAAAGACVAWIRNTVDDALEAAEMLRAEGCEVTLFHARFAMNDRAVIERDVLARFGPAPTGKRSGIVVATQVIEQSLDLDFDILVSDLAPIELLIQRAGRLWRHERGSRPLVGPELLVVSPDPVDEPASDWLAEMPGTQAIYRDPALLWRSAQLLFAAGAIDTPSGMRTLIEPVYAAGAMVPAALVKASDAARGKGIAEGRLGDYVVLSPSTGYCRMGAVWDEDVRTPTRLTEDMVTVRLARLRNGVVVPWAHDAEPARAWALSEVSVRRNRLGTPALDSAFASLVDEVRARWPKYERQTSVLVLVEGDDGWWTTAARDSTAATAPKYHRNRSGLLFPK